MKQLQLLLVFFFSATLTSAQSIPAIRAKALDDSEIVLPNPGSRQILVLVVGFSKKSGELCQIWGKKISADYRTDARIAYFILPVLQSAPSLVRPLIVHGMHKGVPAQELRRFVPLYSNESDWKKLVNFSAPDDAYLIIATPDGHPVWQAHGPYSDAIYADLKKSVATLLEKSSTTSITLSETLSGSCHAVCSLSNDAVREAPRRSSWRIDRLCRISARGTPKVGTSTSGYKSSGDTAAAEPLDGAACS